MLLCSLCHFPDHQQKLPDGMNSALSWGLLSSAQRLLLLMQCELANFCLYAASEDTLNNSPGVTDTDTKVTYLQPLVV